MWSLVIILEDNIVTQCAQAMGLDVYVSNLARCSVIKWNSIISFTQSMHIDFLVNIESHC